MKATGIIRNIDNLGRVVIPKEMRKTRGINNGDALEFHVEGESIILRRYNSPENKTVENLERLKHFVWERDIPHPTTQEYKEFHTVIKEIIKEIDGLIGSEER